MQGVGGGVKRGSWLYCNRSPTAACWPSFISLWCGIGDQYCQIDSISNSALERPYLAMFVQFFVTQSTALLTCINPVNQTIDNVLAGLSGRVEKLQQKYLKFGLQGNSSDEFTRSGSEASITPKNSDGSPLAKQGKKRKGRLDPYQIVLKSRWQHLQARTIPGPLRRQGICPAGSSNIRTCPRKKLRNNTCCSRARIEAIPPYKPNSINKALAIYATRRRSLRTDSGPPPSYLLRLRHFPPPGSVMILPNSLWLWTSFLDRSIHSNSNLRELRR